MHPVSPVRPGAVLPGRQLALAALVAVIWGVNFAIIDGALRDFPPLLFAALRFAVVAVCCLVVPRPNVAWRHIIAVGLFTGTGQYALLYLGMAAGMPSGLTSLLMQAQVLFTVVFAAVALRERPAARQLAGLVISAAGLAVVGLTRGGTVPLLALLLILAAAASWAVGNVCTRIARPDDGFRLTIWSSLVPPLPLLALSAVTEGPDRDLSAIADAGPGAWLSLGYVVVLATIVAMGIWSSLLGRYPADRVVSFALAIPLVGLTTGWLVQGEPMTPPTLLGTAIVLCGLALVVTRARARGDRAVPPSGAVPDPPDAGHGVHLTGALEER